MRCLLRRFYRLSGVESLGRPLVWARIAETQDLGQGLGRQHADPM